MKKWEIISSRNQTKVSWTCYIENNTKWVFFSWSTYRCSLIFEQERIITIEKNEIFLIFQQFTIQRRFFPFFNENSIKFGMRMDFFRHFLNSLMRFFLAYQSKHSTILDEKNSEFEFHSQFSHCIDFDYWLHRES